MGPGMRWFVVRTGEMTKTGALQHEAHEDREPERGSVPDAVEGTLAAGKHADARNTQAYDHKDEAKERQGDVCEQTP